MPERVVDDHGTQVVEPAVHRLDPRRGALQPVGGADVEHQEPVDELDQRVGVDIGGEQLGVPRGESAVAADVEVPAGLGGDHPEVLRPGLGALPRAPRHRRLDLVRRPQPPVAQLQRDGEAHRVLLRRSGTRSCPTQDFTVRSALPYACPDSKPASTSRRQIAGQLLDPGAEHVDPLPAGDLGVEPEVAGHLADHDQPLRGDLAAGDARHHRVGAVALQVGQEVVVGVLQRRPARRPARARCPATRGSTRPPACRCRSRGRCRTGR